MLNFQTDPLPTFPPVLGIRAFRSVRRPDQRRISLRNGLRYRGVRYLGGECLQHIVKMEAFLQIGARIVWRCYSDPAITVIVASHGVVEDAHYRRSVGWNQDYLVTVNSRTTVFIMHRLIISRLVVLSPYRCNVALQQADDKLAEVLAFALRLVTSAGAKVIRHRYVNPGVGRGGAFGFGH